MDSKSERLAIMLDLLVRPGGATTKDIMKRLGVGRKTLYRYMDELSERGFVIEDSPDYYGNTNSKRWSVDEATYPQSFKIKLNVVQQLLLRSFMERGRRFKDTDLNKEVENLRSKVQALTLFDPKRRLASTYSSFKGGKDYSGKEWIIEELCKAIEGTYRLEICYRAAQSDVTKSYDIEPYTLVDHDNALYCIVAIPKHKRDIRILAVERIEKLRKKTLETFSIPKEYNPDSYLNDSFGITKEEPIFVKAKFSPSSALYAKERVWGLNQKVLENDDGSLELSFEAAGRVEIKRWILSFGSEAQLLEPSCLVEELRDEAKKMAKNYL